MGIQFINGFFFISMINKSLMEYYQTNFSLMQHQKWNLEYIDTLIPFERDLYIGLLINHQRNIAELAKQSQ
jgi:hypothetical protein